MGWSINLYEFIAWWAENVYSLITLFLRGMNSGTFGGFFAYSMMEHGDKELPFGNKEKAMALAYRVCTDNPDIRFIDAIYVMSHTAFGRNVKWK